MRGMEESEKANLEFNINKTNIMASGPIISWQIEGGKMEAVTGVLFLGSKITADCNCSHKIRRQLFLGREAMTNLDCVKTKDITLPTKVCKVKAMVFPVVMYRCESWTIKKAECRRIDAFELWYWRRSLESKETKLASFKENQP